MSEIPRASAKQLAYKIKGFGKQPRMSFFLGAGASRQSGIITASEMIRVFRERIFSECCPDEIQTDEGQENWLRDQPWYKRDGSEYCKLFEQFEPKEIGRQRYIESIIEGQEPSFGYVVLANLMASNYINTIITTNFDDLVYSACTAYTGIRPIVYAYGVLASEMRITAERPKILKLHGDFLYSAVKNTDTELAAQDPNMARQLTQVLSEYGLVVIGYSGGDESVMKIISRISDKNDLYWCIKRGEQPNEAVTNLLSEKRGYVVEIDGFDEAMSELRQIVGFDVGKMLGSMQERQDQIVEKIKNFASAYSIDILSEIVEALHRQALQASEGQQQIKKIQALDFFTKGLKAVENRELESAQRLFCKVIELTPADANAYNALGVTFMRRNRYEEAEKHLRKAVEIDPNLAVAHSNLGLVLSRTLRPEDAEIALRRAVELDGKSGRNVANLVMLLRWLNRYQEALLISEKSLEVQPKNATLLLSLADITKTLGDSAAFERYEGEARKLLKSDDWYNIACLESISGNTSAAIDALTKASRVEGFNGDWAKFDPDFKSIRDNPTFKKIVEGKSENSVPQKVLIGQPAP